MRHAGPARLSRFIVSTSPQPSGQARTKDRKTPRLTMTPSPGRVRRSSAYVRLETSPRSLIVEARRFIRRLSPQPDARRFLMPLKTHSHALPYPLYYPPGTLTGAKDTRQLQSDTPNHIAA